MVHFARLTLFLAALCFASPLIARATPTSASTMLARAEARAARQRKNVLLKFGASWCGPCWVYQAFLASPRVRPVLNKYFVVIEMVTGEHADAHSPSNTPGSDRIASAFAHRTVSLPYTVILDRRGRMITSSISGEDNLGFPGSSAATDRFIRMLRAGAPSLSVSDEATLRDWLSTHVPS